MDELEREELGVVLGYAMVGHIHSQEFSLPMKELHKIKPVKKIPAWREKLHHQLRW